MALIPEAIFLVNLSTWLLQVSLTSIISPSDLAVVTCSIPLPIPLDLLLIARSASVLSRIICPTYER